MERGLEQYFLSYQGLDLCPHLLIGLKQVSVPQKLSPGTLFQYPSFGSRDPNVPSLPKELGPRLWALHASLSPHITASTALL